MRNEFTLIDVSPSEGTAHGKYVGLLDRFVGETVPGDRKEIRGIDGLPLAKTEMLRIYNGVRKLLDYRKHRGESLPVSVSKSTKDGDYRVFLRRE